MVIFGLILVALISLSETRLKNMEKLCDAIPHKNTQEEVAFVYFNAEIYLYQSKSKLKGYFNIQ